MSKTFVIGDIHGCYTELQDLLDKAGVGSDDHIISIGDMVNRGPDSRRVLDFFWHNISPHVTSIMGNHEFKHIRAYKGELLPPLSMLHTRWQLDELYHGAIKYMSGLPRHILLDEALLIHAYFEPNVTLENQQGRVLIGTMGAASYIQKTYEQLWYTYYTGDKPIIVGHKDLSAIQEPFNYQNRIFGIDTGCVSGGKLTGIWLPSFEFVSVPARRDHWKKFVEGYKSHE
ncbi:MAG: metallophosphoesterase [Phototrophicales bacterium]|nr:metallophosphoesterase [Phototrophicales bacterium]